MQKKHLKAAACYLQWFPLIFLRDFFSEFPQFCLDLCDLDWPDFGRSPERDCGPEMWRKPRAPWIGKKKTLKSVRWFHVYLMYGFCNFLIEVISERAHQDTPSEEARNEAEVSGFLDARIYLYFVHVPFWILESKWEIPAFLAMLLWTCECFEAFETSLKGIIYLAFFQFLWTSGSRTLEALCCPCGSLSFSEDRFAEKSRTFASWWRDAWSMRHEA